jgi:FkbM family methyltransferase
MKKIIGLGKTVDNLLAVVDDVKHIVVAGHGPYAAPQARRFHRKYPNAHIWSFEPQQDLFAECIEGYQDEPWITMFPVALGDQAGTATLKVSAAGGWSSLQSFNKEWVFGKRPRHVIDSYRVEVITVDHFCRDVGIDQLDLLFLDVQNYEHNVYLGAEDMLRNDRIGVTVGEAIFTDLHGDVHSFHKAYETLAMRNGYHFVGWYRPTQRKWGKVMFCDYIFARPDIVEEVVKCQK